MPSHLSRRLISAAVLVQAASVLLLPPPARAEDDFYRQHKTITYILMTKPGGVYDLYSRLVLNHLSNHLPGKPTIVMKYMPGASGLTCRARPSLWRDGS